MPSHCTSGLPTALVRSSSPYYTKRSSDSILGSFQGSLPLGKQGTTAYILLAPWWETSARGGCSVFRPEATRHFYGKRNMVLWAFKLFINETFSTPFWPEATSRMLLFLDILSGVVSSINIPGYFTKTHQTWLRKSTGQDYEDQEDGYFLSVICLAF